MSKEFTLDESILDIDAWLPEEAIDEVTNAIIEANDFIDNQATIIPLLDYQRLVSEQIDAIHDPSNANKQIIIDCLLVLGMDEARFMLATLGTDGRVQHKTLLESSEPLVERANRILAKHPERVQHSVLSNAKIEAILNHGQ